MFDKFSLLWLSIKSAWARRWTLGIALIAIGLSTAVLLCVERIRADAHHSFGQAISGVDLVVGPRSGSLSMVLYTIFHKGSPTNNIRFESFLELSKHPAVAWAIPISLGDSHKGFSVVGTTVDFFSHFKFAEQTPLSFKEGRGFQEGVNGTFEVVIGSEVGEKLRYHIGQEVVVRHGFSDNDTLLNVDHSDKPFRVVGVLAKTGTPVDRSIYLPLSGFTALHLDWAGGSPVPNFSIPAEAVQKFDLQPKDITAFFVGLKSRTDVFRLQRFINEYKSEPLQAIMPGIALDELWQTLSVVENILLVMSALVVLVGIAGLCAILLASLQERRRELAVLRALGARVWEVFYLVSFEALFITALGEILGALLLMFSLWLIAPWLTTKWGVVVSVGMISADELKLMLLILFIGFLAGMIPAIRASRMSLADGLTPKL